MTLDFVPTKRQIKAAQVAILYGESVKSIEIPQDLREIAAWPPDQALDARRPAAS